MSLKKTSIYMIITYLISFFFPVFFTSFSQEAIINANIFAYIVGAIVMIILYYKNNEPTLVRQEAPLESPVFTFLLGFSGIFISLFIQSLISYIGVLISGEVTVSQNTQNIIEVITKYPLFAIITIIGGPILEEFVYRRSIISLDQPETNFWVAAVLSSAVFSLAHRDGLFFSYFFMGLFFAILYKKTGRIWTSIIAHCGMNALVVVIQLVNFYAEAS
jgi:membrane protease YdiL (CAAX protease family)